MEMLMLNSPIKSLHGIGESRATALQKKGIKTIQDLLNYLPRKYRDTRKIYSVSQIYNILQKQLFSSELEISIRKAVSGVVNNIRQIRTPKKKMYLTELELLDPQTKDKLLIKYFNQPYIIKTIKQEQTYVFWGKIRLTGSTAILFNPEFEQLEHINKLQKFGKITPIYPTSRSLNQQFIRKTLYQLLPIIDENIHEFIPSSILNSNNLMPLTQSYKEIHFPHSIENIKKAYFRLAIQELLELLDTRPDTHKSKNGLFQKNPELIKQFPGITTEIINSLPYNLTQDQQNAVTSIINSYINGHQSVFLYGDVGAGKTIIFLISAIALLKLGYSSILVAPTTVLANQHYNNAINIAHTFKVEQKIGLFTGSTKKPAEEDKQQILIATQAVLHSKNIYHNMQDLALVAFDEEQRFGTKQRLQLLNSKKTFSPYYIALSATPIPQTLAQAFFGYTKAVYIKNRPFDLNIKTHTVQFSQLSKLLNWLKDKLQQKQQAYIVFPRIESTDSTISLEDYKDIIIKKLKPYKVEIVHGRIKDKEQILTKFASGKIQVLMATNLIEVGIDAPNATVMIILGAEQFGLSQLHQLRGRIGRRGQRGYCFVVPSPEAPATSITRLKKFSQINDGIKLAELDLQLRGPGSVFNGIEQTGFNKLKIASTNNFTLMQISLKIYNILKNKDIPIQHYVYSTHP